MDFKQIIRMGLEEYTDEIRKALDGLTPEERRFQPTPESHHIDFAFWHIIRVEDEWLQGFARGVPTVWVRDGWPDRFATAGRGSGWGYDAEQIAALPAFDMDEMMSHFDAVRRETLDYLDSITEKDLDIFPQPERRPEYNVGRMFSHLLVEESQHAGQIAYLRGMQRGLNK